MKKRQKRGVDVGRVFVTSFWDDGSESVREYVWLDWNCPIQTWCLLPTETKQDSLRERIEAWAKALRPHWMTYPVLPKGFSIQKVVEVEGPFDDPRGGHFSGRTYVKPARWV